MFVTIVLVLVTIILSAFFSGSEIAYLSANRLGIEVLKNKGSKRGQILTNLYKDPKSFLSTTEIGSLESARALYDAAQFHYFSFDYDDHTG